LNKKKIVIITFIVLLLFAGLIALTQELDFLFDNEYIENDFIEISENWVKQPPRWFRSNIGGMPLEETFTSFTALRNEYALSIDFVYHGDVPDFLYSYYEENYLVEIRTLHRNRQPIRVQWIFRDIEKNTRVNAVFINSTVTNEGQVINRTGFVEIFDDKLFLISEYRFFDDGGIIRIDFEYNEDFLISAMVSVWDDGDNYLSLYTDYYFYNNSLSLRTIERVFHRTTQLGLNNPVLISFPRRMMDIERNAGMFVTERQNLYPDFFGDIFVAEESKIIYDTDIRGRTVSQTYYSEDGEVEWVIQNTWLDNRIISTTKIEGDNIQMAEFEYNSNGDRILERNYKNGVLERVVYTDGNIDTEELYMNDTVVLRAIWEDGVKISETRVRD